MTPTELSDGTTFPCPIGESMRLRGGGSGIGGQMLTSCPLCGQVSANTAMRSHQPIKIRALIQRLRETEDLAGMFGPGADLVTIYLDMEKRIKTLTADLEAARDIAGRYFQVDADDESVHTHVLDLAPDVEWPKAKTQGDRPSAYDMPIGSVVETKGGTYTRTGSDDWRRKGYPRTRIRAGWIERLFSDGLVTEWRLP